MKLRLYQSSAARNASWSIFEAGFYPIILIATTPFFIKNLGVETYGLWMLVNSSLAFLDMLGFGVNETLIKYISQNRTTDGSERIKQIINVLTPVLFFSVVLGTSIGLFLSIVGIDLFDLAEDSSNILVFKQLVPIAYFGLTLKMVEQFFASIFKGFELYHISSRLTLTTKVLILLSQCLLLFFGFGLYEMFISVIVVLILMLCVEYLVFRRLFPKISLGFRFSWAEYKKMVSFSFWSYFQVVVTTLANQLDKLLIAFFIGLEFLAYYSIGAMVFRQLQQLLVAASAWVFPRVSRLKGNLPAIQSLFKFSNVILTTCIFAFGIGLVLMQDFLFTVWLGAEVYENSALYLTRFIELLTIVGFTAVPGFVLMGSGHIKTFSLLDISFKTLNIIGVSLGYRIAGIEGLLIGLLASAILYFPVQYFFLDKRIGNISLIKSLVLNFALVISFLLFAESGSWLISAGAGVSCLVVLYFQLRVNWSEAEINQLKRLTQRIS